MVFPTKEEDMASMTADIIIRPEIKRFAQEMELMMRKSDEDKGDSWNEMDEYFFIKKFMEESVEYFLTSYLYERQGTTCLVRDFTDMVIRKSGNVDSNPNDELLDTALICMMDFDNRKSGRYEGGK